MILETRHLRLVAAVAELGSLTKAGRELHLTQSALSHQLLDLEGRLRLSLFHRLGKRMVPTVAGLRLIEAAGQALPALLAAEEDLRRLASGRDAVLRLSTECYTCYHWLPSVLLRFRERYARVDVQIVPEATRHPVAALLDGRIDLGILFTGERDQRLDYHPLFRDELVVVTRPDHHLASRKYARAEDFAEEHVILYTMPESESTLFQEVLLPAGVRPARVSSIQLTEGILELVKAGVGITVLARWAVAPHLEAGTLGATALTRGGYHRQWTAATVRQEKPPEYLRAFADLLARGPGVIEHGRPAA
ncbi:MAG: LysR family transcriptional regulator [Gemmatimonadales bacterium]